MNVTATATNRTARAILMTAALGLALGCSTAVATATESGADAVKCVQKELNDLGFGAGFPDGLVGVKTFLASESYVRYMRANAEGTRGLPGLGIGTAREWCEGLAADHPKVASFWEALQASEVPADPKAIFDIAYGFDTGVGSKHDDALAARWYLRAAELGYAPAQRNLGGMFGSGRGVPFNSDTARYWFTAAANQGDAQAQYVLAKHYIADPQLSLAWLWKAAKQGHEAAITELEHRLHI